MQALNIRVATVLDVDAIVSIYSASKIASLPELIEEYDRDIPFLSRRWRSYIQDGSRAQQATGDGFVLIAEESGHSLGYAAYHHTRRHDTGAELQSIYVRKEAQGKGIGSALLHNIAECLIREGTKTMCVGYDPRNPYRRFYQKFGAVEINPHWAVWQDIGLILPNTASSPEL